MTSLMTWLVPTAGPVRDRLAATIDRLATQLDAPRFPPHITLAATVDSAEKAAVQTLKSLVAGVPPLGITFAVLGHEPSYFRSLYLLAEPSAPLMALHEAAQRAWALDPSPYLPHLSLLYSDIAEEQKRPLVAAMDVPLPLTVRFDAVELWARGQPEVSSWYRVAQVRLPGPKQS